MVQLLQRRGLFVGEYYSLTEQIIRVFYEVANELGFGFEKPIYHLALCAALREADLKVEEDLPKSIDFRGQSIGEFRAAIIVEEVVLLELKVSDEITTHSESQLLHYLKLSTLEVGLILAFGQRASYKQLTLSNDRKSSRPAAVPTFVR